VVFQRPLFIQKLFNLKKAVETTKHTKDTKAQDIDRHGGFPQQGQSANASMDWLQPFFRVLRVFRGKSICRFEVQKQILPPALMVSYLVAKSTAS
jgi:hypothetical protein